MDQPALGVAIIGAGVIAAAHAAAFEALGQPVVGVMSKRRASAERLAGRLGAELATDRLAELLAEPSISAVDICAPTDAHAEIALAAAAAGKHIHLEKPLALTLAEADAVIDACARAGVQLMVGQTARYQAASLALRDAVLAGAVGQPFHLALTWNHGTVWPGGWRGWQRDPARSGGHLVHNGVHAFDLACWLLGQHPVRVLARARAVAHPELGAHDYWHALVEFDGGATALCEVGYILRSRTSVYRTATLYGTAGTAHHSTTDDGVLFGEGGAQPLGLTGPDALRIQLGAWLTGLRAGTPPPVTGAEARRALAVGIAAESSVRSGCPEAIAA